MRSNQEAQELKQDMETFLAALERYSEFCRRDGISVRLPKNAELPLFSSLTAAQRKSAITNVLKANEIFAGLHAENSSVFDGRKLLWRALLIWGLAPAADTFDKIRDGDFLQIVSDENTVIYWSPSLLEMMSHTLEQIFSLPWFKLIERAPEISKSLMASSVQVFSGELREPFQPDLPEHYARELDTENRHEIMMKIRWICPLHRDGKIRAALVIHSCRLICKHGNG